MYIHYLLIFKLIELGFVNTDQDFISNLGANIRRYRELSNMSMPELANKVGMDKQNLWSIEKGKSNPQILTLVKLAAGLGITLPLLLSFDFNYYEFLNAKSKYKARKHNNK